MSNQSEPSIHVGFQELQIPCHIGTTPQDLAQTQPVRLSLKVELRHLPSDDLESTLDYAEMARLCAKIVRDHPRALLETLARDLLNGIELYFKPRKIWIRIEKPQALPNAAYAYAEIAQEYS